VASVGAGREDFDPETMFEETDDLSETPVVEGLRAQYMQELETFRAQCEDTVSSVAEMGPDGIHVITARKAIEALTECDPMKPEAEIHSWVAHGMNLAEEVMDVEDVALLDEFSKRLRLLMMMPTLPPNKYLEKARDQMLNLKQDARIRHKEAVQLAKKAKEKEDEKEARKKAMGM